MRWKGKGQRLKVGGERIKDQGSGIEVGGEKDKGILEEWKDGRKRRLQVAGNRLKERGITEEWNDKKLWWWGLGGSEKKGR